MTTDTTSDPVAEFLAYADHAVAELVQMGTKERHARRLLLRSSEQLAEKLLEVIDDEDQRADAWARSVGALAEHWGVDP